MDKFSVLIVSDDPSKGLLSNEIILESDIKNYLSNNVPNCHVDLERIFNDKRCKHFQHYMPINQTSTEHSYKENSNLHKTGNFVKIYISKIVE